MTVNRTPLTSLVFRALCIGTLSSDARSLMQSIKQNSRVLVQAVAKSPFFVSRLDIKPLGNIFKVPQKVISCTDTAFPAGDFFFFFFGHALLIWNLNSLSWKWIAKIVQVKVITHAESLISIRLCAVRFSWILFWFIYCFCWPLRWHPGVATSPISQREWKLTEMMLLARVLAVICVVASGFYRRPVLHLLNGVFLCQL